MYQKNQLFNQWSIFNETIRIINLTKELGFWLIQAETLASVQKYPQVPKLQIQ